MWSSAVALLLLGLCTGPGDSREITHEDIKDAMLSLVHMMRENTEKLERHEARERQLGEQMRKAIALLTKKVATVDGLKTHLVKLDERITGIEQLISQRDERERIQMQKTADALEDLEGRLEGWFTDIENKVSEVNTRSPTTPSPEPTSESPPDLVAKLNDTEARIGEHIARLESGLHVVSDRLKDAADVQDSKFADVAADVRQIGTKVVDMEATLQRVRDQFPRVDVPQDQLPDPVVEEQSRTLTRIKELLEDTSDRIRDLPRIAEVQLFHNETQMTLQEAKHALEDIVTRGVNGIESKVAENKEEAKDNIEALRLDLANNAERVNQELHDLEKGQSVMVSMADHVLDTKKRVEYGVHQILLEVGDLVKGQGVNINNTLHSKINGMSEDIIDNQNGAVANLTTKMEQEMNQVWRQINVMYQQMVESAKTLDKLHKQNEDFVNGTTTTMDGMENKVGEITKRMSEVDENLNYLLGRLSLVTQEFNQIKTGLGAALDNIKASFKELTLGEKANLI
ncbi:centromere-associated protein E [Orussus abietinus]|uniref:centromere-associated protein E n=1 Tax=Orussus abietinus TaxID=222816 RepID=UPI000626653F|nr:centromere-associated protein E [Orussus abietinus]